jgi:hypothetical protein
LLHSHFAQHRNCDIMPHPSAQFLEPCIPRHPSARPNNLNGSTRPRATRCTPTKQTAQPRAGTPHARLNVGTSRARKKARLLAKPCASHAPTFYSPASREFAIFRAISMLKEHDHRRNRDKNSTPSERTHPSSKSGRHPATFAPPGTRQIKARDPSCPPLSVLRRPRHHGLQLSPTSAARTY